MRERGEKGEVTHTHVHLLHMCAGEQECLILVYSTLPTVSATDRNDIVNRCYYYISHHLCFEVASSSAFAENSVSISEQKWCCFQMQRSISC